MKKLLLIATVIAASLGAGTAASAAEYKHRLVSRAAPASYLVYHHSRPRHHIGRHFGHWYHPQRHYGHRYHPQRHYGHHRWSPRQYGRARVQGWRHGPRRGFAGPPARHRNRR